MPSDRPDPPSSGSLARKARGLAASALRPRSALGSLARARGLGSTGGPRRLSLKAALTHGGRAPCKEPGVGRWIAHVATEELMPREMVLGPLCPSPSMVLGPLCPSPSMAMQVQVHSGYSVDSVSNIEQPTMKACISSRFHIYNKITEPVPANTCSQRAKHFRHNIKNVTTHLKTKHVKQLAEPSGQT